MLRLAALAVTLALAVTPAAALAANAPTDPFVPAPQQQEAPVTPPLTPAPTPVQPTTNSEGSGHGQLILLGIGVVALIAGIWIVIARDARRVVGATSRPRTARSDPANGRPAVRSTPKGRRPSPAERRRRKRGRAR